jgi:hypothetical protein
MVPRATPCSSSSTCRPLIEICAICLQRVAKDEPELQEVKDRVARISASCPAYAARDQAGRQGGRCETRSRHRRTGHRRAVRATRTQAQEDARGFGVLTTFRTFQIIQQLALSAELTIPDGTSVQELAPAQPKGDCCALARASARARPADGLSCPPGSTLPAAKGQLSISSNPGGPSS